MLTREDFEKYWSSLNGKYHEAYKESVFLHWKETQEWLATLPKETHEDTLAGRDSLAQEIHGVLKSRGYWVPRLERKSYSDLIGAVGMALDSKGPVMPAALSLSFAVHTILRLKGLPVPDLDSVTEDNITDILNKSLTSIKIP